MTMIQKLKTKISAIGKLSQWLSGIWLLFVAFLSDILNWRPSALGILFATFVLSIGYMFYQLFIMLGSMSDLTAQIQKVQAQMTAHEVKCKLNGGELVILANHKYTCAKLEFVSTE